MTHRERWEWVVAVAYDVLTLTPLAIYIALGYVLWRFRKCWY